MGARFKEVIIRWAGGLLINVCSQNRLPVRVRYRGNPSLRRFTGPLLFPAGMKNGAAPIADVRLTKNIMVEGVGVRTVRIN